MKKCTLCVDRIYNENLPEKTANRLRATCPAGARHFGDLGDPTSDVSELVASAAGYDLMPEQGTKPVNKYLPPRKKDVEIDVLAPMLEPIAIDAHGFLGWIDRTLGKLPGGGA